MRQAERVAVLADVHGNATALEAVLAEVVEEGAELVVSCGDLTWGPQPLETLALLEALSLPVLHVRGNADRSVVELVDGREGERTPREAWMAEQHGQRGRDALAGFAPTVAVDVAGLGTVLCSHGSPRSDEECVTVRTPEERLRAALAGVDADLVATAHTHVQYDRRVLGRRLFNPGSVGLPYEGRRGAYWALLGPKFELRRTEYDVDRAVAAYRATTDPLAEEMVEILLEPPTSDEAIEHAERVVFSG
jgi:predicted phosphodiesterase